jgi:hypothetical protein
MCSLLTERRENEMRITCKDQLKPGMIVYVASREFRSVNKKFIRSSAFQTHSKDSLGLFESWWCVYSREKEIDLVNMNFMFHTFSLSDAGIGPEIYNDYRTFTCESEANGYAGRSNPTCACDGCLTNKGV